MAEASDKLVKVYHPTIDGVSNDVPESTVDAWAEQGWLKSAPKNPTSSV